MNSIHSILAEAVDGGNTSWLEQKLSVMLDESLDRSKRIGELLEALRGAEAKAPPQKDSGDTIDLAEMPLSGIPREHKSNIFFVTKKKKGFARDLHELAKACGRQHGTTMCTLATRHGVVLEKTEFGYNIKAVRAQLKDKGIPLKGRQRTPFANMKITEKTPGFARDKVELAKACGLNGRSSLGYYERNGLKLVKTEKGYRIAPAKAWVTKWKKRENAGRK